MISMTREYSCAGAAHLAPAGGPARAPTRRRPRAPPGGHASRTSSSTDGVPSAYASRVDVDVTPHSAEY
jgi:hypothetical protein